MCTDCKGTKVLKLGIYRCPVCRTGVMIFSDEDSASCYNCGVSIPRQQITPCMQWCTLAAKCTRQTITK